MEIPGAMRCLVLTEEDALLLSILCYAACNYKLCKTHGKSGWNTSFAHMIRQGDEQHLIGLPSSLAYQFRENHK
jgi:hypothetical protein